MPLFFGSRLEMTVPDFEPIAAQARAAEETGFEAVWVRDHLHIPVAGGGDNNPECWTTLAGLARETSSIGIGSLVTCSPFRNPALLAKMAATVDLMSHGRLLLGMGAGGDAEEFQEYGFPMPPPAERSQMLREAVQILRGMCGPDREFSFEGRYYRVDGAVNAPKLRRPPIVIGSSGEKMGIKTVAQLADGWSVNFGEPRFSRLYDALKVACDEIGRDWREIPPYVGIHALIDTNSERAKARQAAAIAAGSGGHLHERWFAGTAEGLLDYLRQFTDRGVRHFITYFHEPGRFVDEIREFGEMVMPVAARWQ